MPVSARTFVGQYEGRASPITDTDPATSGVNLDDVARFAPGRYEFVANAPGYGHVRFREQFRGPEPDDHDPLRPELGVRERGSGRDRRHERDDSRGSGRPASEPDRRRPKGRPGPRPATIDGAGNLSVDGKKVTVDLAATAAQKIRRVHVSALLAGNPNRFTALRQFQIWACNTAEGDDCSTDTGFSLAYTSPADAFPGAPPRPVAPHLLLRSFDIPATSATHLRLVVETSQCTGGPAFQGDQDLDPTVNADCDSGVAATASRRFVRAAELQAFSRFSEAD